MEVTIIGNKVLIKAKNFGNAKYRSVYLEVYVSEESGEDIYSISMHKGLAEIGNMPSLIVSKSYEVIVNNLPKGKSFVD